MESEPQMNVPQGMSAPATPQHATAAPSGWSWGAAGLGWIWGIRFSVWLSFLAFIPALNGIWWIIMGLKGREWAWEAKQWASQDEFQQAMAPWELWGKILFIFSLALPIIIIAVIFSSLATSSS